MPTACSGVRREATEIFCSIPLACLSAGSLDAFSGRDVLNIYIMMFPFQDAECQLVPETYLRSTKGWRAMSPRFFSKYHHVDPFTTGAAGGTRHISSSLTPFS